MTCAVLVYVEPNQFRNLSVSVFEHPDDQWSAFVNLSRNGEPEDDLDFEVITRLLGSRSVDAVEGPMAGRLNPARPHPSRTYSQMALKSSAALRTMDAGLVGVVYVSKRDAWILPDARLLPSEGPV